MIDAHCHLGDFENVGEVILKAQSAGVRKIITCGSNLRSSQQAVEISNQHDGVWATVGLGYEHDYENLEKVKEKLLGLIENKKVVAIGECGLDRWDGISQATWLKQIELFRFHLQLAQETGLPVVVHCRNAFEEVYGAVKEVQAKGQMHCFTGNLEWMGKFVDLGWYVSFGGILTFKKSEELREVAGKVPGDSLLTETDSPYLAPEPLRGKRNTPENVKIVTEKLAQLRDTSINQIEELTETNLVSVFPKVQTQ